MHPITLALFRACEVGEAQAREAWLSYSLESGNCDPLVLKELRTRIDVLREIRTITASDIEEQLNAGSN